MADTATTGTAAAAQTNEPLIRVEGLRKSFGSLEVLKGIDLSVNPGEVVTIIGASGSGKSTFLRCLNLLETPDAGHIWFHGQDLTAERCNINKLREDIGMVFQGFNLFNNMDVLDNWHARTRHAQKDEQGRGREGRDGASDERGAREVRARRRGSPVRWSKTARGHRSCPMYESADHAVRRADLRTRS